MRVLAQIVIGIVLIIIAAQLADAQQVSNPVPSTQHQAMVIAIR